MKKFLKSLFYIFMPLIFGSLVGLLIQNKIDYTGLVKPPLAPPKILFPIAWTIIYLLLGISYFIYIKRKNYDDAFTTFTYYLGLIVNYLWSIIFFVFKLRLFACIWIILLDFIVIRMIREFYGQVKLSAYLNIPYLLWILFASYLTIGIYILN